MNNLVRICITFVAFAMLGCAGNRSHFESSHQNGADVYLTYVVVWDFMKGPVVAYVDGREIGRGEQAWQKVMADLKEVPDWTVVAMVWADPSPNSGMGPITPPYEMFNGTEELRALVAKKRLRLMLPRDEYARERTDDFPGPERWGN